MNEIENKLNLQKDFFNTRKTNCYNFRIEQLNKLKNNILKYEKNILQALKDDLNKSSAEAYMTEFSLVLNEIEYFKKNLKKLYKKIKVHTPITHFKSKSFILNQAFGCVLIISPWNYPFQLSLIPLIGALAAGNCVILKPSNYALNTSKVIEMLIKETFEQNYITTQLGGRNENQELLKQKFDYIFFTGSTTVGKVVMQEAARNLIPVSLELGGKSPCIIDESANIDLAAKRIIWGKLINAGQTCVAVDYIYVHSNLKQQFITACIKYIKEFYGEDVINNLEYPKIINEKHYNRLEALLENQTIIWGGNKNKDLLKIEPTLIKIDNWENPLMQEEIFGPILPILNFNQLDEVFEIVKSKDRPLSCYIFSEEKKSIDRYLKELDFGGGCINDVIIHVSNHNLPFGGVGASGIGRYHGAASFKTFTYQKIIMQKTTMFDIDLRYPPYDKKFKLIKTIMNLFK